MCKFGEFLNFARKSFFSIVPPLKRRSSHRIEVWTSGVTLDAWIMPEKESGELDAKLREIVQSSIIDPPVSTEDMSNMEREARVHMYKTFTLVTTGSKTE